MRDFKLLLALIMLRGAKFLKRKANESKNCVFGSGPDK
jgi:hypothetical protein